MDNQNGNYGYSYQNQSPSPNLPNQNMNHPNPMILPPKEANPSFATASLVCGILSIVSMIMVFTPYIFGGLGIFFGIMSRGKDCKFSSKTIAGIICSCLGILLITAIIVILIFVLVQTYTLDDWNQLMNEFLREYQNFN